jgi:hypothetical protein
LAIVELALLIPILAIVSATITIYLEHQRKMKLIDKGLWKEEIEEKKSRSGDMLQGGMIVACVGLALLIGFELSFGMDPWFMAGLVLLFVGIALVAACYITTPKEKKQ